MSNYSAGEFDNIGLEELESKLYDLIRLCEQLKAENIVLKAKQATLLAERVALVDKNELARERVETILSRLKELEPEV